MTAFVHITLESNLRLIRKVGIGRLRRISPDGNKGIFAVPVVQDYALTHQWVRELRRRQRGMLLGVYFQIDDDEPVTIGHYGQQSQELTAAAARRAFDSNPDARGWEVLIPRRIEPNEISRIARVSQIVGWRFSPTSKGRKPFCTCKFCTRGEYGARRLRDRLGIPE